MSIITKNLIVDDFIKICRFCLGAPKILLNISNEDIQKILKECNTENITCYNDEKLPQHICNVCYMKFKYIYEFKKQCLFSLKFLCDILLKQESKDNLDLENNKDKTIPNSETSIKVENKVEFDIGKEEVLNADQSDNDDNISNNLEIDSVKEIVVDKVYTSKRKSLIDILIKKYKIYDLTCNICNRQIGTRQTLLRHMKIHDQNRKRNYQCNFCNKNFFDILSKDKHTKIKHLGVGKYLCDLCPKKFYHLTAFGSHYKQVHKVKPSKCSYCLKEFNHPIQLKQHEQQKHLPKEFICDTCGKKFKRRSKLRDHQSVHSDIRPFSCEFCNTRFKQNVNLQTHIRLKHKEFSPREMCFKCGILVRPGVLKSHLESHDKNEEYKCELCNKNYSHKYILRQHIRNVHLEREKKYFCAICAKALSTKPSLNRHMRIMHSNTVDNRHVECHLCGQVYKRLSSVKIHIQSAHMNQRPHICDICKKGFLTKTNLKNHLRTHTGEKPYTCKLCDKAYGWRELLTGHMKKVHCNNIS